MKEVFRQQLISTLADELETVRAAAAAAADAATHEEAKPENQYDTRGLEASYLAGAQKERLAEIEGAIAKLKALPLRVFEEHDKVALTALVTVDHDGAEAQYWLMPAGGGVVLQLEAKSVTVLTPQAPLGRVLLGKEVGDDIESPKTGTITALC